MKNIRFLLLSTSIILIISCTGNKPDSEEYRSLFNGRDLTGWETFIGVPKPDIEVSGLTRDSTGAYMEPIGFNHDPLSIFTVVTVDGKPAIRISGQVNGALATTEEFSNYHLRLQYRWGEKKWSADPNSGRNSGVLYHGSGQYGSGLGVWKNSHECQLMESMAGDSYRMGNSYCTITARKADGSGRYVYDPDGTPVEVGEGREAGKIVAKSLMAEKPAGEWNTVDIICFNDKAIHIINGKVNMVIRDSRLIGENGSNVPLTNGNIQLQSEGAEIFFREIEIKNITGIPDEYSNL